MQGRLSAIERILNYFATYGSRAGEGISGSNRKGHYAVMEVGKFYHVVYHYSNGETMIMSDRYKTPEGAMKKLHQIMEQAGVGVRFIKIKDFDKPGNYKKTDLDTKKENADFRLVNIDPYIIIWNNGITNKVSKVELKKLQNEYNWITDF
jgi:hypothetical protein